MDYELHPHEVKILKILDKKSTPEEIAENAEIPLDAVMRASSWLGTKNLVKIDEKITEEISLDKEGLLYVEKGLPERRIAIRLLFASTGWDNDIKPLEDGWISLEDFQKILNKNQRYLIEDNQRTLSYNWKNMTDLEFLDAMGPNESSIGTGWIFKKGLAELKRAKV